jgi:hypothetical protein
MDGYFAELKRPASASTTCNAWTQMKEQAMRSLLEFSEDGKKLLM